MSCTWGAPPSTPGTAADVTVKPNEDGAYAECKPGNDLGPVLAVFCKPPG